MLGCWTTCAVVRDKCHQIVCFAVFFFFFFLSSSSSSYSSSSCSFVSLIFVVRSFSINLSENSLHAYRLECTCAIDNCMHFQTNIFLPWQTRFSIIMFIPVVISMHCHLAWTIVALPRHSRLSHYSVSVFSSVVYLNIFFLFLFEMLLRRLVARVSVFFSSLNFIFHRIFLTLRQHLLLITFVY